MGKTQSWVKKDDLIQCGRGPRCLPGMHSADWPTSLSHVLLPEAGPKTGCFSLEILVWPDHFLHFISHCTNDGWMQLFHFLCDCSENYFWGPRQSVLPPGKLPALTLHDSPSCAIPRDLPLPSKECLFITESNQTRHMVIKKVNRNTIAGCPLSMECWSPVLTSSKSENLWSQEVRALTTTSFWPCPRTPKQLLCRRLDPICHHGPGEPNTRYAPSNALM